MARSVLLALLAATVVAVSFSQTPIPPAPDASSCLLVWPKFGDVYPVSELVYIMFYCNLSEEHRMKINTENGMILIDWGMFLDQGNGEGYTHLKSGEQLVYGYPADGTLSRDFKIDLFQKVPTGKFIMSMKLAMRISVAGNLIDSMNAVVTPASDTFLVGLLGEEKLPNQVSCENSVEQTCDQTKHFDFIEIGTSGFDTLIQNATDDLLGLSVEPLKHLQDILPNRKNVVKISCAIGDTTGWKDIYYIPNNLLENSNIFLDGNSDARFLYGLARVGEISQLVLGRVGSSNWPWVLPYILHTRRTIVRMKTIRQIYTEQRVSGVTFLKLDCEGFDYKIMNSAIDFFVSDSIRFPIFIEFENNSDYLAAATVVNRLIKIGYLVYSFFYEVTEVAHNSSIQSPHSVVYAELGFSRRESADEARAAAMAHLLPSDLILGRDLCSNFQLGDKSVENKMDTTATSSDGYFCSILLTPEKEMLSISDSFTVL
jgi:hypothetical protein